MRVLLFIIVFNVTSFVFVASNTWAQIPMSATVKVEQIIETPEIIVHEDTARVECPDNIVCQLIEERDEQEGSTTYIISY